MLPKGEVDACQSVPLNILSSLPENIIDDILVCLPLRDAVRTSILSKKWRYKWCRLPELLLDHTLWRTTQNFISPTIGFTNIIRHIFALRVKPISKFTLSLILLPVHPKIDTLIYFLSRNGIQRLVLEFLRADLFDLPSSFFSCTQLRHVTLRNCSVPLPPPTFKGFARLISLELCSVIISPKLPESLISRSIQHLVLELIPRSGLFELPSSFFKCMLMRHLILSNFSLPLPPPTFKGFDKLIRLELRTVTISSKLLQILISHSPLLEELLLYISGLSDVVEINAPMLKSFDFEGCIKSIYLKSVPLLVKLLLANTESDYLGAAGRYDIARFLESCSVLEDLFLNDSSIKILAARADDVPTRHPFVVNCVKRLYLSDISMSDSDVVSCALCLIQSLPYLQYIGIQVGEDAHDIPALKSLEVEAFSDFTFNHLREVALIDSIGSKPVMQLTKLLLAKSPMLVKMLIVPKAEDDELLTKLAAAVNSFHRASPDAEVVYNYDSD